MVKRVKDPCAGYWEGRTWHGETYTDGRMPVTFAVETAAFHGEPVQALRIRHIAAPTKKYAKVLHMDGWGEEIMIQISHPGEGKELRKDFANAKVGDWFIRFVRDDRIFVVTDEEYREWPSGVHF